MSNRDNFPWRPNDYSSKTRLRYDLEARHWLDSIKRTTTNSSVSFGEALGFVGLVLGLIFSLFGLVVLLLKELFTWIRRLIPKKKMAIIDDDRWLSDKEMDEIIAFPNRKRVRIN
jgi:hypothetical protein